MSRTFGTHNELIDHTSFTAVANIIIWDRLSKYTNANWRLIYSPRVVSELDLGRGFMVETALDTVNVSVR